MRQALTAVQVYHQDETAMRALVEKWRKQASESMQATANGQWSPSYVAGLEACASDLDAILLASTYGPIAVGSLWVDADPRMNGRTVIVTHLRSGKVAYRNVATDRLAVSTDSRFLKAFRVVPV